VTASLAVHVDQQRDESRLGASEAPAVLGLDPYKSPMAVWRRHRGLPVPDHEREAALWGQLLEPVVRGRYALDRRKRVWVPTSSYTFENWLRCTPDGLVQDFDLQGEVTPEVREFDPNEVDPMGDGDAAYVRDQIASGAVVGLQVKTCSAYLADDWIGGPPAKYEAQVRVEMAVCNLPSVDILCLAGGQKLLGPFRIERDLVIEDAILRRLRAFWAMVRSGEEPTVDDSDAWRLHVSEKLGTRQALEVVADETQRDIVRRWREARRARKAAEGSEDAIKNELLLALSATGATKLDAGELGKPSAYRVAKTGTWALRMPSHWKEDK
jgi:predicted phage-related endonuclease